MMRVLNATTLTLEQRFDEDFEVHVGEATPRCRYGILSHRWEADTEEPTLEDYRLGRPTRTNKGIRKVEKCCQLAKSDGLDLVWSDTCCIDKTSSAELQESINSMYRFYERADICYAYLRDVSHHDFHDTFVKSVWFTRGWTLQELLAPADLRFYDQDWIFLGDKSSLSHLVSTATGIQEDVLMSKTRLQECSVAQRMSWAARRVTSRIEDRAYSLLGIFDVNMTMLYGEGPKAFVRLQEEIIKTLDDPSIFVWEGLQHGRPGLLAPSPNAFASSGNVRTIRGRNESQPYSVNNRGLHGRFSLIPYTLDTYLTLLPCTYSNLSDEPEAIGLFLRRLDDDDQFMRVSVDGTELVRNGTTWLEWRGVDGMCLTRDISIRQSSLPPSETDHAYVDRIQGFRLRRELIEGHAGVDPPFSISRESWDSEDRVISLPPGSMKIHHVGAIDIGQQERVIEVVRFGFDYDYNPVLYLTERGVQYSEEKDQRGVFMQNFGEFLGFGQIRAASFQNGMATAFTHWSRCEELPDGTSVCHMSEKVDGLWPLQADRLEGLDVYITNVERSSPEEGDGRHIGRVRLQRAIVNERLVWDLQLSELAPRIEHWHSNSTQKKRRSSEDDEWERFLRS